ncbi:MAG: hypothetical protein MSC31_18340 [Solirubrobacteraceae bacterium MAG38_C4-C5]|nr:hypothetical protein [Candidatus Siliceabacter maunaloa]
MSISLPRLAALRDRAAPMVLYPLGALIALIAGAGTVPQAVAQRFVDQLGVRGIDLRLSGLVETVLRPAGGAGMGEINRLIVAVVAVVLLGAFIYFLLAIFQTLGGRRGGVESILQVVFALIIGIAGLEVLS